MLLRTVHEGMNAWHIAAYRGELHVMQDIWELARGRLTTEDIRMKYYYAQTMREERLAHCSI